MRTFGDWKAREAGVPEAFRVAHDGFPPIGFGFRISCLSHNRQSREWGEREEGAAFHVMSFRNDCRETNGFAAGEKGKFDGCFRPDGWAVRPP